jgi:hypothetical protein
MAFNIHEMRSQLRSGGARNTLFRVMLNNPVVGNADLKVPFLVQAASLPAWNLGVIRVPYMGRVVHVPGDRTFEPWSVEVINDEDFAIRDALETWNNKIQTVEGNIRDLPSSEAQYYTTQATVEQLSKTGEVLRSYEFSNLWPMNLGEISLSWAAQDQIEVFPATFVYDSYKVSGGKTGNAGGV